MTVLLCVAYLIVFIVGLIGNSFVIAVVFRAPRMRTVTNYFIVNLALADILVICFCLPATLMSNIYVRKLNFFFFKLQNKNKYLFRCEFSTVGHRHKFDLVFLFCTLVLVLFSFSKYAYMTHLNQYNCDKAKKTFT